MVTGLMLLAGPSLTSCRQDDPALSSTASARPSVSSPPASSAAVSSAAVASAPPPSPVPSGAAGGVAGGAGPTAVRACRAADLQITTGPVGAGAGQRYTMLDFRTLHGRTCALRNELTDVHFLRGDGARLPTHVRRTGDPSTSITLRPGVTAHLTVHFTVVGDPRFTPRMLMFTLPGGGWATVAWPHGATVGDDGRIELGPLSR